MRKMIELPNSHRRPSHLTSRFVVSFHMRTLICGGAETLASSGTRTSTDTGGQSAVPRGSRGRRLRSCQPDRGKALRVGVDLSGRGALVWGQTTRRVALGMTA